MKRNLLAALALTAVAAAGVPATASANTTAGTTILNVVTVDYKDVTNQNSFKAAFSTTVTVNLVKSALSVTTPPSAANFTPAFTCAGPADTASGGTFSAIYALTATANGQDNYKLSISNSAQNASSSSATYTILKADGTTLVPATSAESTKVLNSAIVVGTRNADILQFPGGSLKATDGFAAGDIVVVDYGATKTAYLVKAVTLGHAAGYTVNGTTPSTGIGGKTEEERDEVQVEAYPTNIYGIGSNGVAPNFAATAPAVGSVVGQMALVRIEVSAVSSVKAVDATVDYQLKTTDDLGGNAQYVGTGAGNTCVAGNFLATKLDIVKAVRNFTKNSGGAFTATATGDPGDILEYEVTVTNSGGQANSAAVVDNIPSYTKLVTYANSYGVGAANDASGYFAQVTDGTNTVNLTVDANGEVAAQPASPAPNVGFGKAAGISAGLALNFYLGHGSSALQGGTVPSCSDSTKNSQALCVDPATWKRTYKIRYRVKVD